MDTVLVKVLGGLLAIVLLLSGGAYEGYHYEKTTLTAQYDSKIAAAALDSQQKLTALGQARDKIEQKQRDDAASEKTTYDQGIKDLNVSVAKLRASNVRLRDPGAHHPVSSGTGNSAGSSASDQQSGGALSSTASDFLFSFAQRADVVRLSLIACQADDASVRQAVTDYNAQLLKVSNETGAQAVKTAK
jgi:hypothetical protein